MTALALPVPRSPTARAPVLPTWTIGASVAAAVAARLPFLGHAASPDEGGFLVVGSQWHGAGGSLYGRYWVDRPPLLVTIFRAASALGGLTALRLIGCIAVALVVLGVARVAGMIGGRVAAQWAAVTAAGLSISPLLGGYEVNGELLAAPFVLGGVICVLAALRAVHHQEAVARSAAAGALAMSAMLIKQNLADAAIFGFVALVLAVWRGELNRQRFWAMAAGAVAGASGVISVLAIWTIAQGTSLVGVFDAMYPFRIHAAAVQAAEGSAHSSARLHGLLIAVAVSGLGLLLLGLVHHVVTRRRRDTSFLALVAMTLFAGTSVLLGGNYWYHYLVELTAPLSIAAGVLVSRHGFAARKIVAYVLVAGSVAWSVSLARPQGTDARSVGQAIAASSMPHDTIVNAWGNADLTFASGLPSPYAQLWSLPVKTIDPQLTQLDGVLRGPEPPTWFVIRKHLYSWGLNTARTGLILDHDYHRVARLCGHTIFLRNGVDRPTPRIVGDCRGATTPLATMKELLP
ncbi:hypothetical protein [Aeromicrobium ginsengisoli]|uniref:Uncharacterized protein n=1 Tax=Aeromicrobium ginsengisoli TaxID=363867 RepID=A0A5M4FIW5_9ACTN|nr:hypothetical protein [Aeromicrobium ginsengisoli]KAA1399898.1 hypothetical protein ESP70_003850 [Aeromicrobium ginsengisoli]